MSEKQKNVTGGDTASAESRLQTSSSALVDEGMASMPAQQAEALQKYRAAVAVVRAMTPSTYIASTTAEALVVGVVCAPALFAYFTMEGVLAARFPRPIPGLPLPPIPQTFGGLLASGLKYSVSSSARIVFWISGTAGLSAAVREWLRAGVRYEDGIDAVKSQGAIASNAGAGGALAALLLADARMTTPRRLLYVGLGGVGGLYLPIALATTGPFVRAKLASFTAGGKPDAPLR